jgi:CHAT domain-containing protein
MYALRSGTLAPLKESDQRVAAMAAAADGGPHLVLIHGTFSNTAAAFGKLWSDHPDKVRALFRHYNDRVFALDHATLGVSPIANALDLARAAPDHARLHLLTHSRGGLVAEVLARACALRAADLSPFDGHGAASDKAQLQELAALVAAKDLRVDRIVRVACPARGTLLASKRLDAYISVFKWTLELAGVPVLPALVDFLGAVAQLRADPEQMPGLAAQIPDSPLITWLHAGAAPIPGDLRVIAGDVQGDSVRSWLKTLLADSFYWTDNDLVVQTRSMYGGSPRESTAQFQLDQTGDVSHGMYFKNPRTAQATVDGLTQDAPAGFRTIGPLSWAGESATGIRAARRSATAGTTDPARPAVFLLPGILGSNLKRGDDRIWLSWRLINGLDDLAYQPDAADGVAPDGPLGLFYDDLAAFLANTHEVIEFGFDWRRPIEDEARRLGAAVDLALEARVKSGTAVRLIAHSMGGIVARTMQLEAPDVWSRMMRHTGARLVMLGTPNGGSFAPMQVLSGDDTFGNVIVSVGALFNEHRSRQVIAAFPGLLQLQAGLLDPSLDLGSAETWRALADADYERAKARSWWHTLTRQLDSLKWGVPSQSTLTRAVELRRRLDAQRDRDLPGFRDKLLLVIGRAPLTPVGYDATGPDGFVYLNEDTGDGRVSVASARLDGVATWQIDCEHGSLPKHRESFAAYLDLLERGTTTRLAAVPAATRGAAQPAAGAAAATGLIRTRPSRVPAIVVPPQGEGDVVTGATRAGADRGPREPLQVAVINGDLSFIREPLMLGHYRASRLTGTERVMDGLIGGAMSSALDLGLYPDPPGSHQVFVNRRRRPDNPFQAPRPEAVIVVGLGEEGSLRGSDLVRTVRQAAIAWVQRVGERPQPADRVELAATLIGSGGSGISAGQSAQLIVDGICEANALIDRLSASGGGWPRISHLSLIELYRDRAGEACRALVMAGGGGTGFRVSEVVRPGQGALPRPLDSGYRGADYDFLTAVSTRNVDNEPLIGYTIDTRRARTEIRSQTAQGRLLRSLIATASNDRNSDAQLRRTLFQLLVPLELEPYLAGSTEMQIELDRETAGIPWELLDADGSTEPSGEPWAIRCKLLRKLQTEQFREHVSDARRDAGVLVIGEPDCDSEIYPPLPGARAEARAVVKRLRDTLPPERVTELIRGEDGAAGPDTQSVINSVMAGPWRIVHIAAHGEPPELVGPEPEEPEDPPQRVRNPRGVVLSNRTFLGPREIGNLRVVPELVFINCCHLAVKPSGQLLAESGKRLVYDRSRFASGVAEELIRIGVRCVVAAGWAVEDGPAEAFATTFYDALLRRQRFIDAVAEARRAAFPLGGNTWGAYQCYGDPDWVFQSVPGDAQRPTRSLADEFAAITTAQGLILTLDTVAVWSKFQHRPAAEQRHRLQYLQDRFSPWHDQGDVAEAFGLAWLAAGDRSKAIHWLTRAVGANDGGASLKAAEQLANVRTRVAAAPVDQALKRGDARGAIDEARRQIEQDIRLLSHLVAIHPTAERENALGGACKRLVLLARLAGDAAEEAKANAGVLEHYTRAEELARKQKLDDLYYPAMNRMAAELVVHGRRDGGVLAGGRVAEIRQILQDRARTDPDFWSIAGITELQVYIAVDAGNLAGAVPGVLDEYADLHSRMTDVWSWRSVYDTTDYVLAPYARQAADPERAAAGRLLDKLAEYADVTRPTRGQARSRGRPDRSPPARPRARKPPRRG